MFINRVVMTTAKIPFFFRIVLSAYCRRAKICILPIHQLLQAVFLIIRITQQF